MRSGSFWLACAFAVQFLPEGARAALVFEESGAAGCTGPTAGAQPLDEEQITPYLDASYFTDADELVDDTPIGGRGAGSPPAYRRGFCARTDRDVLEQMLDPKSLGHMAFRNPPGKYNAGVCWWHSRFQRNISYLGHFRPDREKPTEREAREIIRRIARGDEVVEIPGYPNITAFTRATEPAITAELDRWMDRELINYENSVRLTDGSSPGGAELNSKFLALHERFLRRPEAIFLRIKGRGFPLLGSHAWLVLDIRPIRAATEPAHPPGESRYYPTSLSQMHESIEAEILARANGTDPIAALRPVGYEMIVIDSNRPGQPFSVTYRLGSGRICMGIHADGECDTMNFYPTEDDELVDIRSAVREYCGQ